MKDYITVKQKILILVFSFFMTTLVTGGLALLIEQKTQTMIEYLKYSGKQKVDSNLVVKSNF